AGSVMASFGRLLHLGNVVVDVVLDVPALPERGGDVLASGSQVSPVGGFNVMVAAARQGLPAAYAGAYGSGPFAALARGALADAGIEVLQRPKAGLDTGFVVAVVDADGERTFLTSPGAEANLTAADLAGVHASARDVVYLSGYGLVHLASQQALLDWLARLAGANVVFLDPGPLVATIPAAVLDRVMRRADWLTCNVAEAAALTGRRDPVAARGRGPDGQARLPARPRWPGPRAGARLPGQRRRHQRGRRRSHRGIHRRAGPGRQRTCRRPRRERGCRAGGDKARAGHRARGRRACRVPGRRASAAGSSAAGSSAAVISAAGTSAEGYQLRDAGRGGVGRGDITPAGRSRRRRVLPLWPASGC